MAEIRGAITGATIRGKISNGFERTINGIITNTRHVVGSLTTAYTTSAETYEGEYEVTPTVDGMVLPTNNKVMTDDLTVKAIPFYNVSNTSGGSTVFIGSDLENY